MRILVINPFGIGDVLFTTPVIRALKEKFPDSFIGYLCNRQVEPVLKNNPNIDELFFFSRGDLKSARKKSRFGYLKELLIAMNVLKSRKFDMAVDLSLVSQYSFVLWLIGVKERWGFDYKNRGRFLNHKIRIEGFSGKHVIEHYRDLLRSMGIDKTEGGPELFTAASDNEWVDRFFKDNSIPEGEILIGISPFGGSSWGENAKSKQWDITRFAGVVGKISKEYKAVVIILGSFKDKEESVKFAGLIDGKKVINACGMTSIGQLSALLKRMNLFIGNDSGPLHMASALGVKTVSVYGPVDERVYGPFGGGKNKIVTAENLSCRPCYKNFKTPVCVNLQCLESVNEEKVLEVVRRLL